MCVGDSELVESESQSFLCAFWDRGGLPGERALPKPNSRQEDIGEALAADPIPQWLTSQPLWPDEMAILLPTCMCPDCPIL